MQRLLSLIISLFLLAFYLPAQADETPPTSEAAVTEVEAPPQAEPAVEVEPEKPLIPKSRDAWVHLAIDEYKSDLFKNQAFRTRAKLGLDVFMRPSPTSDNWTIGGSISNYSISGSPKITRTDLTLSLGYWVLERHLGFLGHLGTSSTYLDKFEDTSNSRSHYGVEMRYRYFISSRVDLFIGAGWMHYSASHLTGDTGVAVTNDQLTNDLCYLFTLGLAKNCGNKIETIDIPASKMVDISAGIGVNF